MRPPVKIDIPNEAAAPRRIDLKALSYSELETFAEQLGLPAYRGRQIFRWLYARGAPGFSEMTDLPSTLRETLSLSAGIETIVPELTQEASDHTLKSLFRLSSGNAVEAVLIPDFDQDGNAIRLTVCVSSQVGCAMACSFCATGQMGFLQNLSSGQIVDQVLHANRLARERFGRRVTNIVFMGMGEPLLNYNAVLDAVEKITHKDGLGMAPRRITVSTVGLSRRIKQLADDDTRFNLAISLHAPTEKKRSSIIPLNRTARTDLMSLREAVVYYTGRTKRQVTYEYCMFKDFNDSEEDAERLADVVAWAPSKVNLIMYNPVEGLGFSRTSEEILNRFIRILVRRRVTVTVRRSRGQDIDAACGQLANKPRDTKS